MSVAEIIYHQLGGNKFKTMTGAYSLGSSEDTLSFRIPSKNTKNNIGGIIIKLEADDTYTMTFLAMRGFEVVKVHISKDVYADMLEEIFTMHTGLLTYL